jgi:hypothetical protein
MVSDAREDVFEPGERIDSGALTGCHEAPQHRASLAAFVTATAPRCPDENKLFTRSQRYQSASARPCRAVRFGCGRISGGSVWPSKSLPEGRLQPKLAALQDAILRQATRGWSAWLGPPRCLDGGDVDLPHRHHRLEGSLCLSAASRERIG